MYSSLCFQQQIHAWTVRQHRASDLPFIWQWRYSKVSIKKSIVLEHSITDCLLLATLHTCKSTHCWFSSCICCAYLTFVVHTVVKDGAYHVNPLGIWIFIILFAPLVFRLRFNWVIFGQMTPCCQKHLVVKDTLLSIKLYWSWLNSGRDWSSLCGGGRVGCFYKTPSSLRGEECYERSIDHTRVALTPLLNPYVIQIR